MNVSYVHDSMLEVCIYKVWLNKKKNLHFLQRAFRTEVSSSKRVQLRVSPWQRATDIYGTFDRASVLKALFIQQN